MPYAYCASLVPGDSEILVRGYAYHFMVIANLIDQETLVMIPQPTGYTPDVTLPTLHCVSYVAVITPEAPKAEPGVFYIFKDEDEPLNPTYVGTADGRLFPVVSASTVDDVIDFDPLTYKVFEAPEAAEDEDDDDEGACGCAE